MLARERSWTRSTGHLTHRPPARRCAPLRSSGLYLVVASALTAAHVQFTLPPFAGEGEPASARAHAALEAQEALAVGMGLPPPGAQPPLRA